MSADPGLPPQPRAAAGPPAPPGAGSPGAAGAAPPPAAPRSGSADPAPNPGAAASPDGQRRRADGSNLANARIPGAANYASQAREEFQARTDLRDAYVGGGVITNSNIHYHQTLGQGDAQVKVSEISAEDLTAPFVRSPDHQRLAEAITGYPFVVLYGPRGFGKRATLVWALRQQAHHKATLFYLAPYTDLDTFSCDGIPEHAVLIMVDVPDGAVDRLGEHTVKRIESQLRAGNRRLAITTSRAASGATLSTGFLVAEVTTRPAPRRVFDHHLAKLLLGAGLAKDDVLGWAGVQDLVAAKLSADCGLADAAGLAQLLSRADRREPGQVAALVRAQITEYAEEKVAQWFRQLRTPKARCMAISLAVLNGQSRELIAHEASLLEKRIMPAPDAPNAPAVPDPFDPDATVSASLLDAEVTRETRMTEHGSIVIDAMSYREPGYAGQVLQYVWRMYDGGRAAIVDWLRNLGASPSLAVRVRAATAAGVLACHALDYVHAQVISPWALHEDGDVRNSAAIALGPVADDQVLRPTVRSLVDGWASPDSDWRLQATAARAYGRTLGLTSPTSALRVLSRLAEVDDIDLMIAVGCSYCELILEGTGPLAVRVMTEVERLAGERARVKQATGRLTLLGLSYLRGAPPSMSEHDARLRSWPTLLVLALANTRIAELAARLWQLGLNDPDIGDMVQYSLDDWAEAAEGSGEMRDCLVRFLVWVAADVRGRRAVSRRAQAWMLRDGKAPTTGRSVLAALANDR